MHVRCVYLSLTQSVLNCCFAICPRPVRNAMIVCYFMALLSLLMVMLAERGAIADSQCDATYVGSGVITSPGYPSYYANNAHCRIFLTASNGGYIVLKFSDFKLEKDSDFLTVISNSATVGRYTGSTIPPVLTLGKTVELRFTSDSSVVATGFSVAFSTIEANCGGLIFGGPAFIRSPGYPASCNSRLVCVWGVVAPQGRMVTLDFKYYRLSAYLDGAGLRIPIDEFSVYDGDTLVASYMDGVPPPVMVLGPAARIVFKSYDTVGYAGFNIVAASEAVKCGGVLIGGTGSVTITSPNYPHNYPANTTCVWTVSRFYDYGKVHFTAFDLEGNNYDTVKIYDGHSLAQTFTGNVLPSDITIIQATVVFTSDRTVERPGFRLVMYAQRIKK